MSRPKSGKKSAKKTPKQQIAELTEQNAQLTQDLETIRSSHDLLTFKLSQVLGKMVEGIDRKQYNIRDSTVLMELNAEVLVDMMDKLIVKRRIYDKSVESRVEELETRLTQMSMDLARSTKKTLAYEQGLDDILQCGYMSEVKDKVYQLQFIADKYPEIYLRYSKVNKDAQTQTQREKFHEIAAEESFQKRDQVALLNSVLRPGSATVQTLENAVRLNLHAPPKRLPGETHIKHMHKELALYLMKELSIEKLSGADWRMLAERVGIPDDIITKWKQQRLSCPMGKVFAQWGQSDSATVRMLHRHLMSPQMRLALLAKRISDFYDVN